MYEVLDMCYTEDECQTCFVGNYKECQEFIQEQGGMVVMYKIVPIIKKKSSLQDNK